MVIQQERDRPKARGIERERERQAWKRAMRRSRVRCRQITGSPQGPELGICQAFELSRQLPSSVNLRLLHHVETSCCRETNRCRITALMQRAVMASISYSMCHQEALALWSHSQNTILRYSLIQWNNEDRLTMMLVNGRVSFFAWVMQRLCFETHGKNVWPTKNSRKENTEIQLGFCHVLSIRRKN